METRVDIYPLLEAGLFEDSLGRVTVNLSTIWFICLLGPLNIYATFRTESTGYQGTVQLPAHILYSYERV